MNHLKMLGLAVLAALALTAMVGAGTASAKVCSGMGKGAACAGTHGSEYKETVKGLTTGAELKSSTINVGCSSEIVNLITNSFTGAGTLNAFAFTGCRDQWTRACTVSWLGSVGTVLGGGNLTFSPGLTYTCKNPSQPLENMTCEYKVTGATPIVTNSPNARIVASGVPFAKQAAGSHEACAAEMKWHGDYSITVPMTIWQT
jgi:hypothetical protein